MTQRLDYARAAPSPMKAYFAFNQSFASNLLDPALRELVNLRASQINGCAYCTDMHVKAAHLAGETELRLHHVAVWRESPLFDARERAALEWTEALTQLSPQGVDEGLYARIRDILGDTLIAELSFAIVAINGWNRISAAFTPVPGADDALFGLDKAGLN